MKKPSSIPLQMISPLKEGLITVAVHDAFQLPFVRQAAEHAILEGSDDLGFQMCGSSLLSLYSGDSRQLDQAETFSDANGPLKKGGEHVIERVGIRAGFEWLSDAGFHVFKQILNEPSEDWITLEMPPTEPMGPAKFDILLRMSLEAKRTGALVMMFCISPNGGESSWFRDYCDEYVEVASCDPDPDCYCAFSFDWVSLRHMNPLGIGKRMCGVSVRKNQFLRRYSPFISAKLETRVMWALRGQGKTLDEIGSLLKVDKSTVLRRLKGLPEPYSLDLDKDWLKRSLELLSDANADVLNSDEKCVGDG